MASQDVQRLVDITIDLREQVVSLTEQLSQTVAQAYSLNGGRIAAFHAEAIRVFA